ncbi:hypothetical protein [Legionella fallonii]|uniref:Uncharacterized protein n=1 Tax=Legionella fallonii LLAP-10 TaxID=1212491 RepID=A0A098G1Y5_9GAMM|nr:hypothetical protein [Legionella fallonii]CEG55996.1 protein of unknown function [Legionella fallonii LLAP-10]
MQQKFDNKDTVNMDIDEDEMDYSSEDEGTSNTDSDDEVTWELLETYRNKQKMFMPYKIVENDNEDELIAVVDVKFYTAEELQRWHSSHEIIKPGNKVAQVKYWHSSNSNNGLIYLHQPNSAVFENVPSFADKKFWIESAVAGGRMYRLLLGKPQPKMHASFNGEEFYRVSKNIPNFTMWEFFERKYTNKKLQTGFIKGKPIVGLTSIFLIANFLADIDNNSENFGLAELDDVLHAVKIDPECCFSTPFYYNNYNRVLQGIKNLKSNVPHQLFNEQELFETLEILISTPLEDFKTIIDNTFSAEYAKEKNIYLNQLQIRQGIFKQAALSLEGFQEFYQERQLLKTQREEEQYQRYIQLVQNYAVEEPQQRERQEHLEHLIMDIEVEPSLRATNPYGFYNQRQSQEQDPMFVSSVNGFSNC